MIGLLILFIIGCLCLCLHLDRDIAEYNLKSEIEKQVGDFTYIDIIDDNHSIGHKNGKEYNIRHSILCDGSVYAYCASSTNDYIDLECLNVDSLIENATVKIDRNDKEYFDIYPFKTRCHCEDIVNLNRKNLKNIGFFDIDYYDYGDSKMYGANKMYGDMNVRFSIKKDDITSEIDFTPISVQKIDKQQNKEDKPSSVYLIYNPLNRTYKIGKANNVEKRLNSLQTGNPDIQLITYKTYATEKDAFRMENMLHTNYQHKNYAKEWFSLNEDDVTFVKQILS